MICVCDIEANGLLPDVTKVWCVTCIDVETEKEYTWTPDNLNDFKEFAKGVTLWVGHNFLLYDHIVLNSILGTEIKRENIFDTLIMSRLLFIGKYHGFSLDDWGKRLGLEKVVHEDWTKFSEEMMNRNVVDTHLNLKLFKLIMSKKDWFTNKAKTLEHQVQWILNKQKLNGFYLDIEKAHVIYDECFTKAKEIEEQIKTLFKPKLKNVETFFPRFTSDGVMYKSSERKLQRYETKKKLANGSYVLYESIPFNLSSPKQIVERLNEVGWKPVVFTEAGTPRICEENFKTLPEDVPEAISRLREWWMLNNRCTVLKGWFNSYNPKTKSIHGTCIGVGAVTHRMAHYDPQMANIPSVSHPYGKELRSCLGVRDKENYRQLGVDIAGIQLCILAHYMDDPEYTKAIASGKKELKTDVHSVNQRIINEVCPNATRDNAKNFIYALLLGGGNAKLGSLIGGGAKEGALAKERLYNRIPAFKRVKNMCAMAAKRGYMIAIDGRRIPIKSEHYALSVYLQANEAIIMKQALVLIDERASHLDWFQMACVHDEIQSCVHKDHLKELEEIQLKAIEDSGKLFKVRCPLSGTSKSGLNWAETH